MEGYDFSSTVEQSAINIITPVMEEAIILSAEYAKACGRNIILAKDMEYCMKYCAMHSVGKKIGTYFPEIYENEEDSDESDIEVVVDEEDQFQPYSGDNVQMKEINQAYDAWDSWKPTNPSEAMIKNAIDSNEHIGS
jgi:hypothetical protein